MHSITAVKIISLDCAEDRRSEMLRQGESSHDAWEFFSAFRQPVDPVSYNDAATKLKFGRSLLPAEIGCYTSHFKCWEWLANSSHQQMIILEDDILIDWPKVLELVSIDFAAMGIDILRLFTTNPIRWAPLDLSSLPARCSLIRVKGYAWGTQGYLISKFAARELVARYSNIEKPVDWVLMRYWEHGLTNYALFPYPVIERTTASTISQAQRDIWDPKPYWGIDGRAMRMIRRVGDRSRRAIFDAKATVARIPGIKNKPR